jgi:hypothetical protein
MHFTPRLAANGRVCCSAPYALCRECAAFHHLPHVKTGLELIRHASQGVPMKLRTTGECGCASCVAARTKAQTPYIEQPPPDGYAMAIARNGVPRTYTSNDPFDGYAAALRKRQEAR